MRTLIPDPPPAEFEALLERRRRFGADRSDEVWEGVLHLMPPPRSRHGDVLAQLGELLWGAGRQAGLYPVSGDFGIGEPNDYRVPDGGLLWDRIDAVYHPTAAFAIEIVSPGDETWDKLPFYASHSVEELLIVDPEKRTVDWLALREDRYEPIERSALIDLGAAELCERIDWPPLAENTEPK